VLTTHFTPQSSPRHGDHSLPEDLHVAHEAGKGRVFRDRGGGGRVDGSGLDQMGTFPVYVNRRDIQQDLDTPFL